MAEAPGWGLAVARRVVDDGGEAVIVGRSPDRLAQAREADHLVITAADLPYGPFPSLSEEDLMRGIRSKLLGPIFAAQEAAPRIRPGGSIIFTSGIAEHRPSKGGLMAAVLNAGLEGLTRALAIELAPRRWPRVYQSAVSAAPTISPTRSYFSCAIILRLERSSTSTADISSSSER